MKQIFIILAICLAFCLATKVHVSHKSKSKVHAHKTAAKIGDNEEADQNEEAPTDSLPDPRTNGNYFDPGNYKSLAWLTNGKNKGSPGPESLIFGTDAYFTPSYIYFKQTATQNVMGDPGAMLEEKGFLFSPDTHDAYLPYYFFKDGAVDVDPETDSLTFNIVDSKLNDLFTFTSGVDYVIQIAPISNSDAQNIRFIADGIREKVYNAFKMYNERIELIKETITQISKVRSEITALENQLKEKNSNGMYEYYLSKANLVKATLSPGILEILNELEKQEVPADRAAARLCDSVYVNGDFAFFRGLMGKLWDEVRGEYDPEMDNPANHHPPEEEDKK